jgi:hypothetical protein
MIEIYHGSTVAVEAPQIILSEKGRDFGVGFYTTDIKEQAIRWAKRKARIAQISTSAVHAILSIYEFDERCFELLHSKHFPNPSEDWLDIKAVEL